MLGLIINISESKGGGVVVTFSELYFRKKKFSGKSVQLIYSCL